MNTRSIALLIILMAAVFSFAVWMGMQSAPTDATAQLNNQQSAENPRTITVTGDADVRVAPDEVIVTLGVETWDIDLKIAKSDNDKRVSRLLALTEELGIEPKYIQTEHISIEPRYDDWYEKQNLIGYFVRKTVVITLNDISQFEDLLTGALEEGATHVHGIQFRTTQLRKYKDEARALAINAAEEKATALAGELDQEIGEPLSISENQSFNAPFSGSSQQQSIEASNLEIAYQSDIIFFELGYNFGVCCCCQHPRFLHAVLNHSGGAGINTFDLEPFGYIQHCFGEIVMVTVRLGFTGKNDYIAFASGCFYYVEFVSREYRHLNYVILYLNPDWRKERRRIDFGKFPGIQPVNEVRGHFYGHVADAGPDCQHDRFLESGDMMQDNMFHSCHFDFEVMIFR